MLIALKYGCCLAIVATLFNSQHCFSTPAVEQLVNQSRQLNLSQSDTWHKLLFYEENAFSLYGVKSAVHSEHFFLSDSGRFSPQSELEATVKAFFLPAPENTNEHAQCKFRGRFEWLSRKLDFASVGFEKVNCSDFDEWSLNGQTESISIVFATGYLGNPASYYGHTLLKLNARGRNRATELEDVTVNYGAIVPEGEGPIPYIFKGLFGGYDAGFSHIQYYFHNHNYGENELRDLWEYELDFQQDELALILGHAWEVLSHKYTYYFTRKNCAYRMAEILQVVDGVELIPEKRYWTVPQKIVQNAVASQHHGKPLVKDVIYHPSRQSRLYKRFSLLSSSEKKLVKKIVFDVELLDDSQFNALGMEKKQKILDVLLDYFQYIGDAGKLDKDLANLQYRKVLAKRYRLPPGNASIDFSTEKSPHKGRNPSMVSLNAVDNSALGAGAVITFRPVYYDALDADYGHVENASLSMGKAKVQLFDGAVRLRELQFFSVESVKNFATGLPEDGGEAWRLSLGLDSQTIACDGCLVAYFRGDMGRTWVVNDKALVGAYLGGSVQQNKNDFGALFARSSLFANFDLGESMKLRVHTEYRQYLGGNENGGWVTELQGRWKLSTNTDLRFSYQRNQANEIGMAFSWYL